MQVGGRRDPRVRGFNPRIETAAYKAGIERLALEIAENGFDESQPLLVFPIREGSKTVLAVRDGHRRLQAVRLANHYLDDGKNRQIDQLPVIIEEWADPRSLTLSVMQRNDQLALTVFETAIVAFRAHVKLGMSTMEIASEFKRSEMHIKGLLLLANADRRIQDLVIEDKTTATTAIKAIRLYKDGAPERLVEVTAGKGKVRPRDLPGERLKRVMRKVGARLLLTIKDIEADPGFKRLRRETRESISDLLEKVREAERKIRSTNRSSWCARCGVSHSVVRAAGMAISNACVACLIYRQHKKLSDDSGQLSPA